MRTRLMAVTAAVCAVTVLGGCQVAVSGTASLPAGEQEKADRRGEQRTAVNAALQDLAGQAAISYTTTGKDTAGKSVQQTLRVTRNGTVQGALTDTGQPVQVVEKDGAVYFFAPAAFWKAHNADSARADQYGKGWVLVDPAKLAMDPGASLTPAKTADALRSSLNSADQLAEPVRERLTDGTEVFAIPLGGSKLRVTTVAPFRVVGFGQAALAGDGGQVFEAGTDITTAVLNADPLKKFQTELTAAVDKLGKPIDSAATLVVSVVDNKLDCNGSNGTCTATVQVQNSLTGGSSSTVHLTMTSNFTSEVLGKQTCAKEADAKPNSKTEMACQAKFTLPATAGSARVVATPTAVGVPLAPLDPAALKQKIDTEFTALGR